MSNFTLAMTMASIQLIPIAITVICTANMTVIYFCSSVVTQRPKHDKKQIHFWCSQQRQPILKNCENDHSVENRLWIGNSSAGECQEEKKKAHNEHKKEKIKNAITHQGLTRTNSSSVSNGISGSGLKGSHSKLLKPAHWNFNIERNSLVKVVHKIQIRKNTIVITLLGVQ